MEVDEVQSRSASVVHHKGQNMSAAQTIAAVPDSIASFFIRRAQTTSVPPGAEAFTAGPVPATATAAAVLTTVRVPVPADVPATAPDAEASQQSSWSAASQSASRALRSRGKLPPGSRSSASIRRLATSMPGAWRQKLASAAITPVVITPPSA